MRANDIIIMLKNRGHERGMQEVVLQLAEEIEDIQKTLKEIGAVMAALTNVSTMQNGVLDKMKEQMDRKDDDPRATRAIVESEPT